jgi:ankyrin repeat protein
LQEEEELAVFNLLLSRGADINLPGEKGRTPLMLAVTANNNERAQRLIGKATWWFFAQLLYAVGVLQRISAEVNVYKYRPLAWSAS